MRVRYIHLQSPVRFFKIDVHDNLYIKYCLSGFLAFAETEQLKVISKVGILELGTQNLENNICHVLPD